MRLKSRFERTAARRTALLGIAASLAVASLATSCGGGGGGTFAAKQMVLVEFLFVDRSLAPSFPTGVQALPRNAEIIFQFSEQVDPGSVNQDTIAIRFGPAFQSVPKGAFQINGDRVIFDPTITAQGTPNPFGLDPSTQYSVELPGIGQSNGVVRNRDSDPLTNSFFTTFSTSDKFLRELVPPSILRAYFLPGQDPLTKQVPGNAILALEFDEPMDPASMTQALGAAAGPGDSVDIRYLDLPDPNVNSVNLVENAPIPCTITMDASAKTYFFVPLFSFGDKKFVFSVQVFQSLRDLAGNALVNPRSFGPFTCDGTGKPTGRTLAESFDNQTDNGTPTNVTAADWGVNVQGQLQGVAISSRTVAIACWQFANAKNGGQYNSFYDPLIGAGINTLVPNLTPPSSMGRRVMWACDDVEIGAGGAVTAVLWGPDSNTTIAAQYPDVVLRIGFQKSATLSLSPSFSGNYLGQPLVMYKGPYAVKQSSNVGNLFPLPINTTPYNTPCIYPPTIPTLQCLYDFRGYVAFPAPSSYFEWSDGDPAVAGDSVLLFDASVKEGDMFNLTRGWSAFTDPTGTALIPGWPTRNMVATYEEDTPNPPPSATSINPTITWSDLAFTITKRISIAMSRFYTPGSTDPAGNVYPPPQSSQPTYGVKSNYKPAILTPTIQSGGATVLVEYQGAFAIDPASNRTLINIAKPSTPFTTSVDDCDGYPYLRWRLTLTSNLITNQVAKVNSILIPIEKLP